MTNEELERFAWKHLERKLAASGVNPTADELARMVSPVRQPLPGSAARDGATPAPAAGIETQTLTRFELFFHRAELTVELNANTGEPMAWLCSKLAEGNTPLTPPEALALAQAAAKPPGGAVLTQQGYEDIGGLPVFVAHWEHREQGILVERDYIRVLVGGHSGRVFAVNRRWHDVDLHPGTR